MSAADLGASAFGLLRVWQDEPGSVTVALRTLGVFHCSLEPWVSHSGRACKPETLCDAEWALPAWEGH